MHRSFSVLSHPVCITTSYIHQSCQFSLVFDYHLLKILLQLSYNVAGCRECVHHASNTFVMDEATGCARVKVQYGDSDQNIEVKIPLNRISTNRKYIEQNIYLFIWFIRGMVHKLSGFC